MSIWRFATKGLTTLDPETAHNVTIASLKAGLGPKTRSDLYPVLKMKIAGLSFPNPLGLAAGFDKGAEVPDQMLRMGFGFTEVGAVTPLPQPGNPKPRVFRLRHEQAVINRYGFNSEGMEAVVPRLAARAQRGGIVGVNLGANKANLTAGLKKVSEDYVKGVKAFSPYVSFCTVNVSSPNTPGLRNLQNAENLKELLQNVLSARPDQTPVFVKIAPDLSDEDKADIVHVVEETGIDGLIVSNTTIGAREGLKRHGEEAGGLSGRPLFAPSTALLREFSKSLPKGFPLIGVGGIFNPDDAYAKILA
ncbi:MAG: quinone-dependent dihydroorotate dehydrogenase, partial [Pseudomonadota bacterium]